MRPGRGPWARLGTSVVLAGGIAAAATAGTMNAEVTRCAAISPADERLACFDALACAAITGANERLACYDELARSRLQLGSGGTPAVGSERAAAAPAAAAGAPPPSAATTAPAISAVATTAAATSAGGSATQSFGLVKRAPPEREQGPKQIEALVQKVEVDRYGNVRVSLDNGQVWDFAEADAIVLPREAVTIRRAALGSFLLTTGSHHTYRVKRRQ